MSTTPTQADRDPIAAIIERALTEPVHFWHQGNTEREQRRYMADGFWRAYKGDHAARSIAADGTARDIMADSALWARDHGGALNAEYYRQCAAAGLTWPQERGR